MFGEIYITLLFLAFAFFIMSVENRKLIYSILSMVLFLSLSLLSLNVEPLYMPAAREAMQIPEVYVLLFINMGFGLMALFNSVWLYLVEFRENMEG